MEPSISSTNARNTLLATYGSLIAAGAAAVAALPGLRLPFLSDDWAHLAAVADGPTSRTPIGYFRPLCMATYWLDLHVLKRSPTISHLINIVLICAAAALAVVLIRRYTGDGRLAGVAGVLFALHPYHVESSAWVAGRPDPLYSVFFLGSALAYDRWRGSNRGWPLMALALFEMALLSKESAVTLPPLIIALGVLDKRRRPAAKEIVRGYVPAAGLALAHLLLFRPLALGGLHLPVPGPASQWFKKLLAFGVSAILPAQTEVLEARPALWGTLAVVAVVVLIAAARHRAGRIPPIVGASLFCFLVLLVPALVSFQERYLFLPSAASAVALAGLLGAMTRRARAAGMAVILAGWCVSLADHWWSWREAGRVSTRLIGALVERSLLPGVREVIVANMPHRVRGAPVAANFSDAVALSGGRSATVRAATLIDYPSADAESVSDPPVTAVIGTPDYVEVRLSIPRVRFSRLVWPLPAPGSRRIERDWATVIVDAVDEVRVRIPTAAGSGRMSCLWFRNDLLPLRASVQEDSRGTGTARDPARLPP